MTSEQLEQHYDGVDESTMAPGGALSISAGEAQDNAKAAALIPKICGLYQTIRPFLTWVANVFFIPKKIKNVINGFTQNMDLICPGENAGG